MRKTLLALAKRPCVFRVGVLLKRNAPIRIISATHDTAFAEIERTYSRYITDHTDDISRAVLREPALVGDNLVAMVR